MANRPENGNNSFVIPSQFLTCPPSNPKVWICDPGRRPTGYTRITEQLCGSRWIKPLAFKTLGLRASDHLIVLS